MNFLEGLGLVASAVKLYREHDDMEYLLDVCTRSAAINNMRSKLQGMTHDEVVGYELWFLNHAGMLVHFHQKVRAMELYGWLKAYQCANYTGEQIHFCTDDN